MYFIARLFLHDVGNLFHFKLCIPFAVEGEVGSKQYF